MSSPGGSGAPETSPEAPVERAPEPGRRARRSGRRWGVILTAIALSLAVSGAFLVWLWIEVARRPDKVADHPPLIEPTQRSDGSVVDGATGQPLKGAMVTTVSDGKTTATRADGSFVLDLGAPRLIKVSAAGYASRVLAVAPGDQPTVGLIEEFPTSLSLRFGGDVMLGRRFYEASDTADAWLKPGASVTKHAAVLSAIAPLLGDADLTVVNLETSLVNRPYFSGGRPHTFNQEKDLVFASAPQTARALKLSGVDVVDLGNNHVFDSLENGLDATINAVEGAGLAHFGAGHTLAQAWAPAIAKVHGQKVAFIGCTTVTGLQYRWAYVVRAGQGGAAPCESGALASAVAKAKAQADVVVVMMHGGVEYQATQDDHIRSLSQVASDAGATLVVNGHPHVVGGIVSDGPTVVAETMGNLAFDQNLWSTLRSYLLRVDLRAGRPVRTSIDPFAISNYQPIPTTGLLADSSARTASGLLDGPMLLGLGRASTTLDGHLKPGSVTGGQGTVATIPPGQWLPAGDDAVTPGQDLLFGTGGFEKMDVVRDRGIPRPLLWGFGKYTRLSTAAACTGTRGLSMVRKPASDFDVIAAPLHRVPVTAGDQLTLTADVRRATPTARLEVRWYADMLGGSKSGRSVALGPIDLPSGCRQVQLSVTVPDGVLAAQPYLRLVKPQDPKAASELQADNVRLVRWSPAGSGGRFFDTVRLDATTHVDLRTD